MKKMTVILLVIIMTLTVFVGCSQAERVSANVSQEADNFNVVRQLTVINAIQGDVLFQMTAKMSITADVEDNQLEVIVEDEDGNYQKHFVGLSDNVTYIVEQKRSKDVSNYQYTLNFNPKMWIPVDVKIVD
jgi:outer membrane lipoprotein-sorting protein